MKFRLTITDGEMWLCENVIPKLRDRGFTVTKDEPFENHVIEVNEIEQLITIMIIGCNELVITPQGLFDEYPTIEIYNDWRE